MNVIPMCPKCGVPMVWHEGGVSKKPPYKPYQGFYGCPNWKDGCKETYKPAQPTGAPEKFNRSLDQDNQQTAEKVRGDKIAWLNAKNNATKMVADHESYRSLDMAGLRKEVALWTNWYYAQQPLTTKKIVEDKEIEKEMEGIADNVPF